MAIDLSFLSQTENRAQSLSNLILVSPGKRNGIQPKKIKGQNQPAAFLFHYEGENSVTLDSDVTDHFVEDNTAIQDQVALKPVLVSTRGYIGELNNVPPQLLELLRTSAEKLTSVEAFVPQLTATAIIAYNVALQAYQAEQAIEAAAVSAWNSLPFVSNLTEQQKKDQAALGLVPEKPQTQQQQAFMTFFGYWNKKQLFTVQTPWAIFDNMIIKTIRITQDETTNAVSDFEITFKQMRFAQTLDRLQLAAFGQGRFVYANASEIDYGVNSPPENSQTFAQANTASGVA